MSDASVGDAQSAEIDVYEDGAEQVPVVCTPSVVNEVNEPPVSSDVPSVRVDTLT